MSEGNRIPYAKAKAVANDLMLRLRPFCERIEIAGSLRRKKATIGDIELVLIPKPHTDLFQFGGVGEEDYALELVEQALVEAGGVSIKGGRKYKMCMLNNKYPVDLFITTPAKWGCIYTIRTGSAAFSKRLMTARKYGGLCPSNLKFNDGRLWGDGAALDTPEEIDVFNALGIVYIDPEDRTE